MTLGRSCYAVQRLTSDYVQPILAVLGWYQSIGGGLHEKQPIVLFLITQEPLPWRWLVHRQRPRFLLHRNNDIGAHRLTLQLQIDSVGQYGSFMYSASAKI